MLNAVFETAGPVPLRPARVRPDAITAVQTFIDENFAERITLEQLAALAKLSVFRFVTVFSREMGISPHRYLCQVRVRAAQSLLRHGVRPAIVAIEVGFFDQSHLCRHFRAVCGMTPGQYLTNSEQTEANS